MRRLRRGHSRPCRGFQHAGRLHTQIRERAHARCASDNGGGAVTAATLASAAGGGSCGGVTSADVHLGLAEADRGSLSAYGSDLLSSPLPSSARSGSSQDMAHSSDMGESCGLLPSPPQHRGGRRERHRAAGSAAATGSAAGSATGSVSVASSSRRSASGGRTRGGEGEYSGQTLQSLGLKKTELIGWLARWEHDFEREHRRHVASGLLGYTPPLLAVGYIPPLLGYASPLGSTTARRPRLPGRARLALGGAAHSGEAAVPLRARVSIVTGSSNYGRAASRPTRGRGTATGLGPKVADSEVFGLQARKQAHPRAEGQLARVPAHAPRAQACVAAAPPPRHVVRQPSRGGIQVVARPLLSPEQRGVAVGGGRGGEQPQQLYVARHGGQRRPKAVQGLA